MSTENSFSFFRAAKKKFLAFRSVWDFNLSSFGQFVFHGLATDSSDLTINNLLKPDLVWLLRIWFIFSARAGSEKSKIAWEFRGMSRAISFGSQRVKE